MLLQKAEPDPHELEAQIQLAAQSFESDKKGAQELESTLRLLDPSSKDYITKSIQLLSMHHAENMAM